MSGLVTLMVIGSVDMGGSGYCFNLALTSVLAMLSPQHQQKFIFWS